MESPANRAAGRAQRRGICVNPKILENGKRCSLAIGKAVQSPIQSMNCSECGMRLQPVAEKGGMGKLALAAGIAVVAVGGGIAAWTNFADQPVPAAPAAAQTAEAPPRAAPAPAAAAAPAPPPPAVAQASGTPNAGGARQPLPVAEAPEVYQRVLTLPGAKLLAEPARDARAVDNALATFSVFYVFGRRGNGADAFVEVGRTPERPDGWIEAASTERWNMMLVMQYAPVGRRGRVPFFENRETLAGLISSPRFQSEARALQDAIQSNRADRRLVAVEPGERTTGSVDFLSSPYLLPILSWDVERFDNGTESVLLEVASASSNAPPPAAKPLRMGLVFVIDTTISMDPYMEEVLAFLEKTLAALQRDRLLDRLGVGLVAYRNNLDGRPGLEYVVRNFLPLASASDPARIVAAMRSMSVAKVSTHSFSEDAFAGVHAALQGMDWEPFGARLVVLVTDSSALNGNDPKASQRGVDAITLQGIAQQKRIAVTPMHLNTPEAQRANDIARARRQYQTLGSWQGTEDSRYIAIPAGAREAFRTQMDRTSEQIVESVKKIASNQLVERPSGAQGGLSSVVVNELFRAQMTAIGETQGTRAPSFQRAWAADRDLADPDLQALDVAVFLTRNQLNELGQHLSNILDAARRAGTPAQMFDQLRSLSAAMSQDPVRFGARFESITQSNLLPAFLRLLPYRSKVLTLTPDFWVAMGASGQREFLDEIDYKLTAYRQINENTRGWRNLGGASGLEVFPMPLVLLP